MRIACALVGALSVSSCVASLREPVCPGADPHRDMSQMRARDLPAALRRDLERYAPYSVEAWYRSSGQAVVILVSKGEDRELSYTEGGGQYTLLSDAVIPCLQE